MKDPAFLFYPNDYLGGTMGLTFEQKGAYIDLLMMQFNRGHMTLHMIGQMLGHNFDNIWDAISDKFKIDADGLYYNERLEIEQNKRKMFSDSRRNNISGKNQYTDKPKKTTSKKGGHMTLHMEDENVNVIISKIKDLFDEKYINESVYKTIFTLLKNYEKQQIIDAIIWARSDDFWKTNFQSPNKLLSTNKDKVKYIDVFIEKMKAYKPATTPRAATVTYKRNPAGQGWETVTKSLTAYKFDLEAYGKEKIILIDGN